MKMIHDVNIYLNYFFISYDDYVCYPHKQMYCQFLSIANSVSKKLDCEMLARKMGSNSFERVTATDLEKSLGKWSRPIVGIKFVRGNNELAQMEKKRKTVYYSNNKDLCESFRVYNRAFKEYEPSKYDEELG
jgi:hypothetical protein